MLMDVTTDLPCGNGRVRRTTPQTLEVELIAYSKNPRYTFFEIANAAASTRQTVELVPDAHYHGPGLSKLAEGSEIWLRRLPEETWRAIPRSQVRLTAGKIAFEVDLAPNERVQISTEPPRPYAQTTAELAALAREHAPHACLHVIGASIEQRPIVLLRVAERVAELRDPDADTRPAVLLVSGEHATEFAGEEVTRGMLQAALADDEAGRFLRRRYVLDFVLNANPDGNVHGWHQYNARDWAQHSYTDGVDRSWHHEFTPYLSQEAGDYSPETRALGDWILKTRPALVHLAHSWEGGRGRMGAYRVEPERLAPALAATMERMDRGAIEVATGLGIEFEHKSYSMLGYKHLDAHMVLDRGVLACATEAHPRFERSVLQTFGQRLLKAWLLEGGLELRPALQDAAQPA